MFRHKKKSDRKEFDREKMIPAVRSSICTGEKVAGFRNKQTGKFEEVMMIRTEQELQEFIKNEKRFFIAKLKNFFRSSDNHTCV